MEDSAAFDEVYVMDVFELELDIPLLFHRGFTQESQIECYLLKDVFTAKLLVCEMSAADIIYILLCQ